MSLVNTSTLEESTTVQNFKALSNLEYLQQVFQLVEDEVPSIGLELSKVFEEERKQSKTLCELLSRPKVKEIYRPKDMYRYVNAVATKIWLTNDDMLLILATEDSVHVRCPDGRLYYSCDLTKAYPTTMLVGKQLHDFESSEFLREQIKFRESQGSMFGKKEVRSEEPWKTKFFYPVADAVVLNF